MTDINDAGDESVERAPARTPTRGRPRLAREPVRSSAPRAAAGEILGRDGEVLTRKRSGTSDPFHIDPAMIEPGWEMQWIAHSVIGNAEVVQDQHLGMLENGWRPVPAKRFPGRFMPAGTSPEAHIVRGGQGLYERPKALCDEARAEDYAIARQQMIDRDQALMGRKANLQGAMQNGFAMSPRYRGTGGDVRMSIDPALDVPAPSHQLADPGE